MQARFTPSPEMAPHCTDLAGLLAKAGTLTAIETMISPVEVAISVSYRRTSAHQIQLLWRVLLGLLTPLSLVLSLTNAATAQTTSAQLRGQVVDSRGEPVSDAVVELLHASSAEPKSTQTNTSGQFVFNGLRVGGPYQVGAKKAGLTLATIADLYLTAGSNPSTFLQLGSAEKIEITAKALVQGSTGKLFDGSDIARSPSIGRDPKDIVRMSPDAYVDGNQLSIGGQNNRYNSVTIDGIRQDDDFGLNNNGYPTQRSPVPLGAIEEISLNRSPFDVRYGNFLGGNVNIVTKSGTNEFHGSVVAAMTNNGLTGNKSKDQSFDNKFETKTWALTLGGPILKDELHFFLATEGLQDTSPNNLGVAGSGQPIEVSKVTGADVSRAQDLARNVYDYNAGSAGKAFKESDFKIIGKVDWTINDQHRLESKVQRTTGNSINSGFSNSSTLAMTSNWYDKTDTLETYSLRLFSDWSYDWASKMELSQKKVTTRQEPLEGNGFMTANIDTADKGTIVLGPDPYRHANELDNETTHLGLESNYSASNHLITSGFEYDKTTIYNLFVPNSNGSADYNSLDDFQNRSPSQITYSNAISNNPKDAAAELGFDVKTLYLQDDWQFSQKTQLTLGLRTEFFGSEGKIDRNENFVSRYGFANTATVAGKSVLLPRLGAKYQPTNRWSLSGGLGLYSGGTPNVWLANSYSNNGVNLDSTSSDDASAIQGFDGRQIPEVLKQSLQAGDGNVDALDPDFKIPQNWKLALASKYRFDIFSLNNFNFDVNYTFSKVRYGLLWKDLRRNQSGFAGNNAPTKEGPDGRALYDTNLDDKVADDFDPNRGYDMLLTNTDKGFGHTLSFDLNKTFQSGFHVSTAYAWQRVKDINPGNSSRSASNYGQVAIGKDPNDPDLATSNYERTHRFLITTSYQDTLIGNLLSTVSLFMERRSGQPYSYTFGGKRAALGGLFGEDQEFAKRERMLFYVPKGDGSDVILDGIDEGAFNDFLRKEGLTAYRGRIAPRNAFQSSWVDNIDLRLAQELPGWTDDHRAVVALDVENLPNLLNKKWGQVKQVGFPYLVPVVDVKYDDQTGKYVYSNFRGEDAEKVRLSESVWKAQLSVSYMF